MNTILQPGPDGPSAQVSTKAGELQMPCPSDVAARTIAVAPPAPIVKIPSATLTFRCIVVLLASGSDRTEGFGWGEAGRADGGEEAGDPADEQGRGEAARPGGGGDDRRPVLGVGVDGGGKRAGDHAGCAAEQGEEDRLGEELRADLAFGSAEGAAKADLGATFEDADQHDVADPDRADQQRDCAEAEEEAVEGALCGGAGGERGGGLADVDLVGCFGVGGGGKHGLDGGDLACLRADVDGGRMVVEGEVALGGRKADQDGAVDFGGEQGRVEDAGDVEPLATEPDPFAGNDAVDSEPLGGGGAEHRDR